MKDKILIAYAVPRQGLRKLEKRFDLIYPDGDFFTNEDLLRHIGGCVALLSIFNREIPKEIIEAGTRLKVISNYGVGVNNIDIDFASKANIAVCNTPEAVCEPTAELCFGLLLSLSRRIAECNYKLKTNPDFEWGVMKNLGVGLQGKTLGIIGMGKIGKSVADKARAFGMKVIYNNRKPVHDKKYSYASYTKLAELLEVSDFISLHCPLTKKTHHLMDQKEFSKMKSTAFLINTSRGAVVNERSLVAALQNKEIAGAALDVFEEEPHIHKDLLNMDNVVLVPHIGTATRETRIDMAKEASQNIIDFLLHGKCKNKVN